MCRSNYISERFISVSLIEVSDTLYKSFIVYMCVYTCMCMYLYIRGATHKQKLHSFSEKLGLDFFVYILFDSVTHSSCDFIYHDFFISTTIVSSLWFIRINGNLKGLFY